MESETMRMLAITGLVLVGVAQAQQVPETIFGLELNAPISIPECQLDKKSKTYIPAEGACYKRDQVRNKRGSLVDATGPLGDERVLVYFAYKNSPAIMSGFNMRGVLRGGILVSVGTNTGGIRTQAQDFAQLQEKYGKPTRLEPQFLQNAMGAKYEGLVAEWELPTGTYVRLESPDMLKLSLPSVGGVNVGAMSVSTAAMQAERQTQKAAVNSERTKL
jgi:hypothetical protein